MWCPSKLREFCGKYFFPTKIKGGILDDVTIMIKGAQSQELQFYAIRNGKQAETAIKLT